MRIPRLILLVVLLLLIFGGQCHCPAASVQSQNFVVIAATPELAQKVSEWSEFWRKDRAVAWLGKEMPAWDTPCPLRITVTTGGAGGATEFRYGNGRVASQSMHVEGPLDRILRSVLPHEITHCCFAAYFGRPVPRWCDEGGAVLSEDDVERTRQDTACRAILNGGRTIPLARLFALTEYPDDVMALYAEGYCVTNWLVSLKDRPAFLGFVASGMDSGWNSAVRMYGFASVDELEAKWLSHMKDTKGHPLLIGSASPSATPISSAPGIGTSTTSPADPILAALAQINRKLDVIPQLQSDVAQLKARLDRLEGAPATPWTNAPQRTMPVAPASSLPTFAQPPCPGGVCPGRH